MTALNSANKRVALELLPAGRLRQLIDSFELVVEDRRSRDSLVGALADGRKLGFARVLGLLSRDELKGICEALGLDTSGRAKQRIIDRILVLGVPRPAGPSRRKKRERGSRRGGRKMGKAIDTDAEEEVSLDLGPGAKLTREQLEGYLWAAADILRGSIDSSDYKNFIFGLLFLKRLSDRFEEECEELVRDGHDPEDPDEHQFFVPRRARWPEIQKAATGLGEVLNKASAALEEANTTLEGVLAGIDYNDERKLGDTKQRDSVLHQLVQHFSGLVLRNDRLSEPDMLGRAYEYLIEKFADDAGKKGGEFYTPNMVVKLIVELLEPKEGMRICDPTVGSGGMLIQSAKYITEHGGQAKNFSLFGQEKNLGTWAICKMNMLLHGFPDARIEKGDTIRDPKLLQDGELMLFDRVIANPPFSLDAWGREVAETDSHGRFRFGIPPKSKGDLAFLQHMIATLNVHGKMGIVMPHGVLFRGSAEGSIRQGIVEEDLVEAAVGLAPNLFYGTGIPAVILILNRDKPKQRKGKVLFVHAGELFVGGNQQNVLSSEHLAQIAGIYRSFAEKDRLSAVASLDEIAANDFTLNITRYVDVSEAEAEHDVARELARLKKLMLERTEAEARMAELMEELGFGA